MQANAGSELRGYPPQRPRWVLAEDRDARYPFRPVHSLRSRILWQVAQTRLFHENLWTPVQENIAVAWAKATAALDVPPGIPLLGVVSDPSGGGRMVLIPAEGNWVAKIGIDDRGAAAVKAESAKYELVSALVGDTYAYLPAFQDVGEALLIERLPGPHPSWDDQEVHSWIAGDFCLADGRAVPHCDLTPWNVVKTPDAIRVIDWEMFDQDRTTRWEFNLLDFVLRGAALRKAPTVRVRRTIARWLPKASRREIIHDYKAYRRELGEIKERRRDQLVIRSAAYLSNLR